MKQILNEWRKYLVEQDQQQKVIDYGLRLIKVLVGYDALSKKDGDTIKAAIRKLNNPLDYGELAEIIKDLEKRVEDAQSAAKATPHGKFEKLKQYIKSGNNFSYVLGTVDGEILATHNENKLFYGASSNKPFLALFNLIKCSAPKSPEETPCECLRDDELRALLNYDPIDPKTGKKTKKGHKGDSNVVNRALSNRPAERYKPEQNRYITVRRKQLCKPTGNKQATDFLAKLGFDTNMLVRYGPDQNKQSALGYFKLLSFLAKPEQYMKKLGSDLMQNQNFVNAANHVLRWMKREFSSGKDREHKGRFLKHLKDLQNLNLPVKSLYGKGGFAFEANNSAMIIDNKYIFVLFTSIKSTGENKKHKEEILTAMSHVIADVLINSGAYIKPPTSKKPVYQPK